MAVSGNGRSGTGGARDAVIERILVVTGEEAARVGPERLRMGEIAVKAGVSRASLYRYFASKDELIRAYTLREIDQIFASCDPQDEGDFERRSAELIGRSIVELREHPVFREVFDLNDDGIMRSTLTSADALAHARELVLARFNAAVREGEMGIGQFDSIVVGELITRLVVSLASAPETVVRLETQSDAREFAERYVVPLIGALASTQARR